MAGGMDVPEVLEAVHLEDTITKLRSDISSRCSGLLREAREVNAAAKGGGAFRMRLWENRINSVIARNSTYSISELRRLSQECEQISRDISRFRK